MYMFQCYSLKSSHPLLPLSPRVCSLRLCLLCCPACRVIGTIFLNSICMRYIQYFSFGLTSLCTGSSTSVELTQVRSCLYLSNIPLYMYHSCLIRSSANGHLGCFRVLAIVNSAAVNVGVHVSVSLLVSLGCLPSSGIAGSHDSSIPSF